MREYETARFRCAAREMDQERLYLRKSERQNLERLSLQPVRGAPLTSGHMEMLPWGSLHPESQGSFLNELGAESSVRFTTSSLLKLDACSPEMTLEGSMRLSGGTMQGLTSMRTPRNLDEAKEVLQASAEAQRKARNAARKKEAERLAGELECISGIAEFERTREETHLAWVPAVGAVPSEAIMSETSFGNQRRTMKNPPPAASAA